MRRALMAICAPLSRAGPATVACVSDVTASTVIEGALIVTLWLDSIVIACVALSVRLAAEVARVVAALAL